MLFSLNSCKTGANITSSSPEQAAQIVNTIKLDEVIAAQQAWVDALVEIGRLKTIGGDYRAFAEQVLSSAYHYDNGEVLFKPTLAHGDQTFRSTKTGALAYFVGGVSAYPDDKGFALKPWKSARFVNSGVQIHGNVAITMGNVFVVDADGNEVMVDKTWAFKKGDDDQLRIILHHSSLPFTP
ncbi:MAG: hypothetical protein EA412_14140 [Chitinophagaceae bacterium]|nr:MAG: hypothetical protein EA412_14140 [Chitinophagaceae bacterium]